MVALTAAEIAKLAFGGAIQAGAGALSQAAIERAKKLRQKIREKFQGNPIAEQALNDVEKQQSPEILEQEVVPLLQMVMRQDPQFAQEIQVIAQQINQEINASAGSQKNLTSGDVQATDSATAILPGVRQEVKELILPWLIKPGLVLFFALLVIELLIPRLLKKTSSNLETLELLTTGVSMKFNSEGKLKTLKIINVPAYQPGVFSDVKLEKNKIIEIKATGLVTTGGTFPLQTKVTSDETGTSNPKNQETPDGTGTPNLKNQKTSDGTGNWIEAFKELKLNADFQVAWRDPNGETIFAPRETIFALGETTFAPGETTFAPGETTFAPGETIFASGETIFAPGETIIFPPYRECLRELGDKRKLVKKLPYGFLLGVIVELGSNEDDKEAVAYQLQNKNSEEKLDEKDLVLSYKRYKPGDSVGKIKKIIPIGQEAVIEFNDYTKKYEIKEVDLRRLNEKEAKLLTNLEFELTGHYIYFVVNDSLLENQDAFTRIEDKLKENKCLEDIGGPKKIEGKDNLDWKRQIWNYQSYLYDEMKKSDPHNPSSIWFLNNRGSFTVTILETKK